MSRRAGHLNRARTANDVTTLRSTKSSHLDLVRAATHVALQRHVAGRRRAARRARAARNTESSFKIKSDEKWNGKEKGKETYNTR